MYCIFCYTEFFDTGKSAAELDLLRKNRLKIFEAFVKTSKRIVGVRQCGTLSKDALESCCMGCLHAISNYCKLAFQYQCLQLRLDWQTQLLLQTMTKADKCGLKGKRFKRNFINPGDVSTILKFREQFIQKSKNDLQRKEPNVMLARVNELVCKPRRRKKRNAVVPAVIHTEDESFLPSPNLQIDVECSLDPNQEDKGNSANLEPKTEDVPETNENSIENGICNENMGIVVLGSAESTETVELSCDENTEPVELGCYENIEAAELGSNKENAEPPTELSFDEDNTEAIDLQFAENTETTMFASNESTETPMFASDENTENTMFASDENTEADELGDIFLAEPKEENLDADDNYDIRLNIGEDEYLVTHDATEQMSCNDTLSMDASQEAYSSPEVEDEQISFILPHSNVEENDILYDVTLAQAYDKPSENGFQSRKLTTAKQAWLCDSCNKKFSTKFNLKRHIVKLHPDSNQHITLQQNPSKPDGQTNTCRRKLGGGIGFGSLQRMFKKANGSLRQSQWRALEYRCQVCQKRCQNSFKLNEHMRTHSGERPYSCGLCTRRFGTKSNLKRHCRLVHKMSTVT